MKEERRVLSAARGIIDSSVVIRRKSPLPAAPRELSGFEFPVCETVARILVSDVNPVVQVPNETTWLVFHVSSALPPLEDFDFFVRDAVPVRIAVVPEVKCVGDSDHDPVVQRQNHAGKEQIVDKHGALVISSVTIGVLMARDPAFRFLFTGGIRGLHISPHFHDVQYAVSIPGHGDRFLDMRFAQDELKGIAFGQFNRFAGIFNREKALLVDFVPGGAVGWNG